ncbi:hypothetical protein GCM10009665_46230 [Kitasatospora nipponensis]|uniref:Uncharacterized protein n=1 Tax=Kitasatospora nipponensis TaxID=258049 RepID=A0ABN1WHP2_9ACTN
MPARLAGAVDFLAGAVDFAVAVDFVEFPTGAWAVRGARTVVLPVKAVSGAGTVGGSNPSVTSAD